MPKKEREDVSSQIHRLMGEFLKDIRPLGFQPALCFHPPMDVYETEGDLVIVLEIPGMNPEDIHVFFDKDLLSISGRRIESCSGPKTRLHQMEIDYGDFVRTLRIPFPLKTNEFRALYRQGFLLVTVPKLKEPAMKIVEVSIR